MERLADLVQQARFLACLEAAGVDSWEGFDEALRQFEQGMDSEDD
jgi:hypothetical protein